jgi:hypothetical protein
LNKYTKETMLVLCTAHLTHNDSLQLIKKPEENNYPFKILNHDAGWILHVPKDVCIDPNNSEEYLKQLGKIPEQNIFLLKEFSESFKNLLRLAQKEKCLWINLDSGEDTCLDLPIFDW